MFFKNKTVDGILASFHQTIQRLEAAAEKHAADAIRHAEAAMKADASAFAAKLESSRAAVTADNLRRLLTGSTVQAPIPSTPYPDPSTPAPGTPSA